MMYNKEKQKKGIIMKRSKVFKGIMIALSVILAVAIIIVGILFFPLTGKKNKEVWSREQAFDIAKIRTVEKDREDFKILMFTDTQLWTILGDNKRCYEEMDKLVEKTNPDLITLPGDVLSAFASRFSIRNFIKHMDSYKIPWAPVYGNHDEEIPTNTKNWQSDRYMKSEYCLLQKGPNNLYGSGNYVINITEDGKPVYTVFMFDNGKHYKYETGKDEVPMSENQIAWYEWNVKGIAEEAGRTVPSMTFSHFPQPEFREAVEKLGVKNEDGSYTIPSEYGFGKCNYLPWSTSVNTDFVEKCKELGSTKYIFCGHDHENDASIFYDGITYTYGLKTGPSPKPWNGAEHTGGTLITINGKAENQTVNIEHITITQVK